MRLAPSSWAPHLRAPIPQSPAASLVGAAIGILVALLATATRAEVGVTASATTDYQYQGVSLNPGQPTASLGLSLETRGGGYAGVVGIGDLGRGPRAVGHLEFLGYAWRGPADLSWDVGVSNLHAVRYAAYPYAYDIPQVYAGLRVKNLSYYIYYSPRYYNSGVKTLYFDVSGSLRPAPRLRLFGHVGALEPLSGGSTHPAYDLRAGAAIELTGFQVQLAWTLRRSQGAYAEPQVHNALVLGVAAYF